ncbi:chloramphenicol acetyltransferase [Streptomyces albus]|nr:chloramphenicol acetyltransferase [Streptomyces albus]
MDAPTPTPTPIPVDLDTWPRRRHFAHYRRRVPCTYAMTVEVDVTTFAAELRRSPRKSYLAQVWALATVVNRHDEFRMCLTASGDPAVWPVVHPAFTVFNPRRETFACVWAPYDPDFGTFHDTAAPLLAEHSRATDFFPQGDPPPTPSTCRASRGPPSPASPSTSATAGTTSPPSSPSAATPDATPASCSPLSVQIHHAAADGFHTARLTGELQTLLATPTWL